MKRFKGDYCQPADTIDTEICPECGSEMEITDSGEYRNHDWENWKCFECGETIINEPDWDSMPGGHDDY